ncbi:MAG TPA: hypothetical protein DEA90_06800, partial [Opitutae bacterium]|nr:hypothetical protein [Opitutae bacterium]
SAYSEGLNVGYRYYVSESIQPLFPFGHGLSYTDFEYKDLQLSPGEGDAILSVRVDVTNTGSVPVKEVVQLYLQDVEASVYRPKMELKGFEKISLAPGETQTVCFELSLRDLSFYDDVGMDWKAESGEFIVHIGRSSQDIRLRQSYQLDL